MTDAAVVGRILREYHQAGIEPSGIRRLTGSVRGARVSYWLGEPRGPARPGMPGRPGGPGGPAALGRPGVPADAGLVVRAFRTDMPLAGQFRGGRPVAVTDWLRSRAATLDWLAEHAYPAPRVIRTRSGDLVGLAGVWATLATTYVTGTPLGPGTGQLRLLGEALGRLHALGAAGGGAAMAAMGRAAWDPETATPAALRRLEAVESLTPADWRPLLDQFRAVLLAVRQRAPALPSSVVHGDPWPGNAIHTAQDQVTLIDWENAGLGLPLLDLGFCLLECHLDVGLTSNQPSAWPIQPDENRIAAIVAGYTRWRRLQPAEKDLLLEGIRFPAAYVGAIHFEQALLGGGARQVDGRAAGAAAEPARRERRRRGARPPSLRLRRRRQRPLRSSPGGRPPGSEYGPISQCGELAGAGSGVAIFAIPISGLEFVGSLLRRVRQSLRTEIRSRFTIGQAGLASVQRGSSWPCQPESSD